MKELIKLAQSGDADAFVRLLETQTACLYRAARGVLGPGADAEDAVSQTVLDCWEKLPELREARYFKTWLVRILLNNCNDILRGRSRLTPLDAAPELGAEDPEPSELETLLNGLDGQTRAVLLLYYGEGFKIREIAAIVSAPPGTVSSRLKRGREKLRQTAQKEGLYP